MRNRNEQDRRYDKHKRDQEAKRFYNSTAWKNCRQLVLGRDNYLCQECLKEGVLTTADMVHHIEHFKDKPDKALVLENLISLCNACHNKEHPEKSGGEKKKETLSRVNVITVRANKEII
ncbi:HNH endonuclease signature motif containing protein [Bacillus wiedmannii]|uniref:HNH endonuclease signature motif containing protein n=1 Tax=Bacillus wiedmannii TaxID=1890302 RepID=UPI000BEFE522|nr:HNH endonuclease signature motif containing protein [Bacillus wiedmannii]MCU5330637.1 HNH endonuclease [Bacillus wiedmannii]PEL93340.1 endonuclease [Bacillus wiedmannii]